MNCINSLMHVMIKIFFFFTFLLSLTYLYAQNYTQECETLVKQGEYVKAVNRAEEGIQKEQGNYPLYLTYVDAALYSYSSKKDTSENILIKAFQKISVLSELSNNSFDKNKFKTLSKQLTIPVYRKAAIYINNENYPKAKDWFEMVASLKDWSDEFDPDVYFYAGLAAYNSNDNETMVKYFDRLNKKIHKEAAVYEILGGYYFETNNLQKSKEVYLNALNNGISINFESVFNLITIYEKQKNCSEFNTYNNKMGWFSCGNMDVEKAVARVYYLCKDTAAAIEQYKNVVSQQNNDTVALIQLGIIYYNRGINELKEAKSLIAKSENNIIPFRKLRDLHIEDMKSCIQNLDIALNLNVSSPTIIQCLYNANKYLQRKEAMTKLKNKYQFIEE